MPIAAQAGSHLLRKAVTLGGGLLLVGTGVALTITAELGVAPYDVLTTGVAERTGLPIGLAAMILPLVFVILGTALGQRPGPGTLITVLGVGPILGTVLGVLPELDAMAPRLAFFATGFVVLATGITLIIVAELGPGPAEMVMLAIHDRGHPLATTRTGIEVASVVVGWGLGGQVGAGTVVAALLMGLALRVLLSIAGYRTRDITEASDAAAPGA